MSADFNIITCVDCKTKNRVPVTRMNEKPVCGKCGVPLALDNFYNHPINITDHTLQSEVLDHKGPVLVDGWAPWCGPCRSVAPILDKLAAKYAGKFKITKLNVDENQMTASRFTIKSIPTMLFFDKGKLLITLVGAQPEHEIENQILKMLS